MKLTRFPRGRRQEALLADLNRVQCYARHTVVSRRSVAFGRCETRGARQLVVPLIEDGP